MKLGEMSSYVLGICTGILLVNSVIAETREKSKIQVDMYRSRQVSLETIHQNKVLMNKLNDFADILLSPKSLTSEENIKKAETIFTSVSLEISKLGDFKMASLSPLMYPDSKTVYFTIDLVDKADQARLDKFMKAPAKTLADPEHLIDAWKKYEKTGEKLFMLSKSMIKYKSCPAFHCVYGFEHPELKKYLPLFDLHVERNKSQLTQILKQDKNAEKRSAAAYLLSHIRNGRELIELLTPSMRDVDGGVRNAVMRVLAQALIKVKTSDFPVQDLIDTLDYPHLTDRNKGLYIMQTLVREPKYAKYISQHARPQLLQQLKMTQKNVHDQAYDILKQISGKNFAERDYRSWELWLGL